LVDFIVDQLAELDSSLSAERAVVQKKI
jgi:hypothetical protein